MTWRILSLLAFAFASPALAEDEYDWESTLIHSELPLYDFEWSDFWPRGFTEFDDETFSIGCVATVSFGDWRFTPNPANESGDLAWYRFENYGAFHCATNILTADEREELSDGEFSRGFFARIGNASKDGKKFELWVLQQGMVPGSDYLLLSRPVNSDGTIDEFNVLQSRCPKSNLRVAKNLDIWITRYCLINRRGELLRFARRMLKHPELGTLKLIHAIAEGSENEAPDPSENSNDD